MIWICPSLLSETGKVSSSHSLSDTNSWNDLEHYHGHWHY